MCIPLIVSAIVIEWISISGCIILVKNGNMPVVISDILLYANLVSKRRSNQLSC